MSSWDEIAAYLRTEYDATERDGNIALVFTWENEGRTQALSVSSYEDNEVAWMSIVSGVCKEEELPHRAALERSSQLPVGGLILVDGSYLLSYCVPVALVNDTTVIDDLLLYVAAAADTLESEIAGTDEN